MQLYQHYKGELFAVILLEPLEAKIINFTENHLAETINFVKLDEFHETVEYEGRTGPRYRVITDPGDIMPEGGHP